MKDHAIKALLYSELVEGSRKIGRPLLRFNDTLKDILKRGGILHSWKETVVDRPAWRKFISDVCDKINNSRQDENKEKRAKRHEKRRLKEKRN